MQIIVMLHNFILAVTLNILFTFDVESKSAGRRNEDSASGKGYQDYDTKLLQGSDNRHCWITLNAKAHFENIERLEEKYIHARQQFEDEMSGKGELFDDKLLDAMLESRGRVSGRTGDINSIPAGLNLGGYCMMRMEKSVLFFHRMKLRNNTHFRINNLHTDLRNMQITAHLSLNDLHLVGSYERAMTDSNPSIMYYTPTYGEVEILLRNHEYRMEGKLRLLEDSLFIVLTNSDISFYDARLKYKNNATAAAQSHVLSKAHIDEFVQRMKSDLDEWLRDYFNEHLIFFTDIGPAVSKEYREYEKSKITLLNNYVEDALIFLKHKLRQINATSVIIPGFSIFAVTGMEIKISNGVIRGLDTMYRRSVAVGYRDHDIRKVDAIVGFSSLKVIYKYHAYLTNGAPPLTGLLILTADDLAAHMGINLVKEPETVDLQFDFIQQLKPESLTVEGPANRMIANFKHILEHHIISIMSNALTYNIQGLRSLTRCQPSLFGHVDPGDPAPEYTKYGSGNIQNGKKNKLYGDEGEDGPSGNGQDETGDEHNDNEQFEKVDGQEDENSNNGKGDDQSDNGHDENRDDHKDNDQYDNKDGESDNVQYGNERGQYLNGKENGNEDSGNENAEPEVGNGYDQGGSKRKALRSPDYVVKQEDSIEVELPPNEEGKLKRVHLAHIESLNITNLK